MIVISTNIAEERLVKWRGKNVKTGIYKLPVNRSILLDKEEVNGDVISDRKYHGGVYKACYLFSADYYNYWKKLYPDLEWDYGMFGENITVSEMDDSQVFIGSIYAIGSAEIKISIPREPCFKLGIRFGSQRILKQFIEFGYPGAYAQVLKSGYVSKEDTVNLIETPENKISVKDLFDMLYSKEKNLKHLEILLEKIDLPPKMKGRLASFCDIN